MAETTLTKINAAEHLDGTELEGGWRITTQIAPATGATGGHFSLQYWAEHEDGRQAFCKVLNYQAALHSNDAALWLQKMTEAYNFERDLLRACNARKMSRIVVAIADGQFSRDGYALPTVTYILFERAHHRDVRYVLDTMAEFDTALKLRSLHNVATGLMQLHGERVAHQDLKPSNILLFDDPGPGQQFISKVADLGRASMVGRQLFHDDFPIAGDRGYAPPEQLYGYVSSDFDTRRIACDLYQLGSLICFLFTGSSMNALLTLEMHPAFLWHNWSGNFDDVSPYVRDAFGRCLGRLGEAVPEQVKERLVAVVSVIFAIPILRVAGTRTIVNISGARTILSERWLN